MICSVTFDTFLPKKKSLSFPKNLEQSRSIEHREGCTKWEEVQKKKGGWFYRRATKGNDGRLSLVQGSLIEGETSSNLDETRRFLLRLLPPPLSTRSSPISDVDCSDDARGGKDSGFRKGNRAIFSPVFLQHDPNQPLFRSIPPYFPSSFLRWI